MAEGIEVQRMIDRAGAECYGVARAQIAAAYERGSAARYGATLYERSNQVS